jgi:hypothetical protein
MSAARQAELREAEDAGYALLGRAFAKAMQETAAPETVKHSARALEDWIFANVLREDEAHVIHHLTGFKFQAYSVPAGSRFPAKV